MKNNMTGGQLTQIYTIATQQGCGQEEAQSLIESGHMAAFFAGRRGEDVNRTDFRKLEEMEGVKELPASGIVTDPQQAFETFRTLKLGTGIKDADGFREAFKKVHCDISEWGDIILDDLAFRVAETETEVELVVVSNKELGFRRGATVKETYARAKKLGLNLCPNEVGPQLCLQYEDQPRDESLLVAMKPIIDSEGELHMFHVKQGDRGRQLLGADARYPDFRLGAGIQWVFLRRKYRAFGFFRFLALLLKKR
jgi:hypothetical protein